MSRGQLVPDATIVRIFLDQLKGADAGHGAILDGFPRTRNQAVALDEALAAHGDRVDHALYVEVPLEDLVARMASRRICAANGHVYNIATNPPTAPDRCDLDGSPLIQRPDDQEETVRARMAQQVPPLEEVADHYRAAGILRAVDGRQAIDDVSRDLIAALDEAGGGIATGGAGRTHP
jgi:adenylate kinase